MRTKSKRWISSINNIQAIQRSQYLTLDQPFSYDLHIEKRLFDAWLEVDKHAVLATDTGFKAIQYQHPYAHKDFVPEHDLPNPYPGDTYRTDPGSSAEWYAPNNYQWIEYDYDPLIGKYATGREVDYRNQVLTEKSIETKTVQKTIVKSSTCECKTLYNYQWKIYESLISRDANFEYCGTCGDKRNV